MERVHGANTAWLMLTFLHLLLNFASNVGVVGSLPLQVLVGLLYAVQFLIQLHEPLFHHMDPQMQAIVSQVETLGDKIILRV